MAQLLLPLILFPMRRRRLSNAEGIDSDQGASV
jgi:hypothetical protein